MPQKSVVLTDHDLEVLSLALGEALKTSAIQRHPILAREVDAWRVTFVAMLTSGSVPRFSTDAGI